MRNSLVALSTITLALAGVLGSPSAVAQSSRLVIASGLDNPRGLAFHPDGSLYVAEAGRGGSEPLCLPEPNAPPGTPERCFGATGAVTRITDIGVHQRIATGLPSLAGPSGRNATGPHDLGFGFGTMWLTIGLGGDPAIRAPFAAANIRFGYLVRLDPGGNWTSVLDLSAFEASVNPDGGLVDSNPYGLTLTNTGAAFVDAGGNALINIAPTGAMSTLAVFPDRAVANPFGPGNVMMQSVPTTVVQAPGGGYFVGELTGFPFQVGAANVYRVPAGGGTPVPVATGFTNIIDIALAPGGGGYVLEHDADGLLGPGTAGRLVRINPDNTTTVLTGADLIHPGGVTVGPDGAVYVTNKSTLPGEGEVIRLVP